MRVSILVSVWLMLGVLIPSQSKAYILLNTAPPTISAPLANEKKEETSAKRSLLERVISRRLNRKLKKLQKKWATSPDGCSKIVLQNGEIIEANIIQITPDAVKYKRCGKPGDPEIVVRKAEVLSVIAEDGGFLYRNNGSNSGGAGSFDESYGPTGGQTDGLAIASISAGGGALIFAFIIGILGILAGIAAVILGILSMNKIKRSGGKLKGKGLALTGIILGGVVLLLTIIGLAILL